MGRLAAIVVASAVFGVAGWTSAIAQSDTLSHGGLLRTYSVYVPATADTVLGAPVVMAFHGGFGNSENIENQSGLSDVADEEGFIAVYPMGTGTIPTWNGGECCGFAAREDIDDVGFVDKLIARLAQDYRVDLTRVYATGISNGGAMTYRLACELPHRFAAFGPVAVTFRDATCAPDLTVPVVHFHSELDENVPMMGGMGSGPAVVDWLPLDSTLSNFASYNSCTSTVDTQVSDSLLVTTWTNCATPEPLVKLYLSADGGHSWPGGQGTIIGDPPSGAVDASREMWSFFQQFSRSVTPATEPSGRGAGEVRLEVYPNPADDYVTVVVDGAQANAYRLLVFDLAGRVVLRSHPNGSRIAVGASGMSLAGLPAGFYVVALADARGVVFSHSGLVKAR